MNNPSIQRLSATFTALPRAGALPLPDDPRQLLAIVAEMLATEAGQPVRVTYQVLRGKAAVEAAEGR